MMSVLTTIWLAISTVLMGFTFLEGWSAGARWDGMRLAGLGACLVWPVSLPILVLMSWWHFHSTARTAVARRAS